MKLGQINGLITALGNIISNFFVALGVVVLVCTRIPWLMIPVIISFAVNSYTTSKVNKGRRKFFKEMSTVERGSTYFNTELQESRYAKDIRLYDASEVFEKKYDGYVDRIYGTSKKYFMGFLKYWNVNNIFYSVSDMTIYILLVVNIFNKTISIGEFSSLFQATGEFASAIRNIVNSYLEMNYTSSVLKFYIDFVESVAVEDDEFDSLAEENGLSDNITLEETENILTDFNRCEIEFKDVSFKYPNTEKYILKNVSATIKAGETCCHCRTKWCREDYLHKVTMPFVRQLRRKNINKRQGSRRVQFYGIYKIVVSGISGFQTFCFYNKGKCNSFSGQKS